MQLCFLLLIETLVMFVFLIDVLARTAHLSMVAQYERCKKLSELLIVFVVVLQQDLGFRVMEPLIKVDGIR